jgi:hypothetical protein
MFRACLLLLFLASLLNSQAAVFAAPESNVIVSDSKASTLPVVESGKDNGDDDVVIKAMRDELGRSMKELKLPKKPAPYFISYRSSDETKFSFACNNGSPIYDWKDKQRTMWADVRVGDYAFDDTADVNGDHTSNFVWRETCLDDNYSVIRRALWQATDEAYKSATEVFDNMVSYKQQHSIPNLCESFSKEPPVVLIRPVGAPVVIPAEWKDKIKQLSLIVNKPEGVRESWVSLQVIETTRRIVNSEGTTVRDHWCSIKLGMVAFARCPDGEELWDSESLSVSDISKLPGMEALEARAKVLSERLVKHASSPIKDYYLGPVLLEAQPTAEFTIRNVAPLLCAVKGDNLRPQGTLLRSLNSKVMPGFISISDDPDIVEFKNIPTSGTYTVDSEGVVCQKVKMIDHGFLKDLLSSRSPVLPGKHSNGHDFIGTAPTTIVVDAEKQLSEKLLRDKMVSLAKDHGLQEYLVIRRIRPSTPLFLQGSTTSARDSSLEGEEPVEAIMVSTTTGAERNVRGLKFKPLYKPSLQDILCAGSNVEPITTTLWNGYLRTVICPSLLLSKIELEADSTPTDSPYPVAKPKDND